MVKVVRREDYELVPYETGWVVTVRIGNDWGEPDRTETRHFESEEELHRAIQNKNYYEVFESIELATQFRLEYNYDEEEY